MTSDETRALVERLRRDADGMVAAVACWPEPPSDARYELPGEASIYHQLMNDAVYWAEEMQPFARTMIEAADALERCGGRPEARNRDEIGGRKQGRRSGPEDGPRVRLRGSTVPRRDRGPTSSQPSDAETLTEAADSLEHFYRRGQRRMSMLESHTFGPFGDEPNGLEHDGSDASRLRHVEEVLGIDRDQRGTGSTTIDVIAKEDFGMVWEHLNALNERLRVVEERLRITLTPGEENR